MYDSQVPSKVTASKTSSCGSSTATRKEWMQATRSTESERGRRIEYSCDAVRPPLSSISNRCVRVLYVRASREGTSPRFSGASNVRSLDPVRLLLFMIRSARKVPPAKAVQDCCQRTCAPQDKQRHASHPEWGRLSGQGAQSQT